MTEDRRRKPSSASPPSTSHSSVRRVTSAELLKGDRELLIEHEGDVYRLRVTRNGKLILYK